MRWEHRSVQFKTEPSFGARSRLSDGDLRRLDELQNEGWEVTQVVNMRGSLGFTSHVVFLLRREVQ